MESEELRILLRTVADTRGAEQTNQALRGVQSSAQTMSRTVREGGGLFGSTADMVRFAGSLVGVNVGLNLAAGAADNVREALRRSVEMAAESVRLNRTLASSYGSATPEMSRFADALSRSADVPRSDILRAAIDARTLAQNYGLSTTQIETLITRTNDLAVANGMALPEAFQRVQSAMRGEAESAEALGLVLNANFLAERLRAQGLQQSFTTMTQAQQAQVIYTEFLRQSNQFAGTAANSTNDLDRAINRTATSWARFQLLLGQAAGPTVSTELNRTAALLDTIVAKVDELGAAYNRLPDFVKRGLGVGGAVVTAPVTGGAGADVALFPTPTPPGVTPGLNVEADLRQQVQEQVAREARIRQAQIAAIDRIMRTVNQPTVAPQLEPLQQLRQTLEARARPGGLSLFDEQASVLNQAAENARKQLDLINQLEPLDRQRVQLARELADLQREQTANVAEQAQIELSLLPQRQELARLDRELNSGASELNRLMRERQVLLAQQAAAPAANALADTQAAIERARLLLRVRGTGVDERVAARQQIRDLTRNVLPGQELAAFDAQRQVDLVRRAAGVGDIAEQLRDNAIRQRQAEIRAAIAPAEGQLAGLQAVNRQLELLGQIATAGGVKIDHQITVTIEGAVQTLGSPQAIGDAVGRQVSAEVIAQLNEATQQAAAPPAVQQSGISR